MRLWLIRHPKPDVAEGVCYGVSDVVCAARDVQTCALSLASALPPGLQVLSSPLQRCSRLAQSLQQLRADMSFASAAGLMEMDFGAWEMQAWSSIAPSELEAWAQNFAHFRCGQSGQSAAQFVSQVGEQLARSLRAGADQVWISHAGVMRALLWLRRQNGFAAWAEQAQTGAPSALSWNALLANLCSAEWPQDALAFCQVLQWDWPDRLA